MEQGASAAGKVRFTTSYSILCVCVSVYVIVCVCMCSIAVCLSLFMIICCSIDPWCSRLLSPPLTLVSSLLLLIGDEQAVPVKSHVSPVKHTF